jgi:sugar transferase (PEP-CTERM/EpsH1 system associated)
MRRTKIIHVVRTLATGGTEGVVRKLLAGLDPELFEQKVCTLVKSGNPASEEHCLNSATGKLEFLVPYLAQVFMRERPDVVHSRNWATIEAIAAAKLSVVPAIVHSEHGRDLSTQGAQPIRRRLLRRLAYGWADRLFCVSQELKDYYCRELKWGRDVFEVIPNGVDVEQFRPDDRARAEIRAKLQAGPKTMVVGTVGRLDPIKDHLTFLRAGEMALGKGLDVRLVIVGDGVQRAQLESTLSRNSNLARRTTLTGDVRNVAQFLNGFDVFVLPSLSEGMSNTLLESMAVGVPPIVTAVGGNTEVVEEGRSGLTVDPRDAERICDYLVQLAADEPYRKRLGHNARQRVSRQFSIARMLDRYTRMYCELTQPTEKAMPALRRA